MRRVVNDKRAHRGGQTIPPVTVEIVEIGAAGHLEVWKLCRKLRADEGDLGWNKLRGREAATETKVP